MDALGPLSVRADGTDKNLGGGWFWVILLSLMLRARFDTSYQCKPASQFASCVQAFHQAGASSLDWGKSLFLHSLKATAEDRT